MKFFLFTLTSLSLLVSSSAFACKMPAVWADAAQISAVVKHVAEGASDPGTRITTITSMNGTFMVQTTNSTGIPEIKMYQTSIGADCKITVITQSGVPAVPAVPGVPGIPQ